MDVRVSFRLPRNKPKSPNMRKRRSRNCVQYYCTCISPYSVDHRLLGEGGKGHFVGCAQAFITVSGVSSDDEEQKKRLLLLPSSCCWLVLLLLLLLLLWCNNDSGGGGGGGRDKAEQCSTECVKNNTDTQNKLYDSCRHAKIVIHATFSLTT